MRIQAIINYIVASDEFAQNLVRVILSFYEIISNYLSQENNIEKNIFDS